MIDGTPMIMTFPGPEKVFLVTIFPFLMIFMKTHGHRCHGKFLENILVWEETANIFLLPEFIIL